MRTRRISLILILLIVLVIAAWIGYFFIHTRPNEQAVQAAHAEQKAVEQLFLERRQVELGNSTSTDPFGTDGVVRVLLVGLDSRVGQTSGHCDVIQFIEINRKTEQVQITAVPRGTYSPLPGGPHASSSYYVSNACGIGGLEYGIKQIERILGRQADYLVTVGFSETLGMLRHLELPTTETLQWLRHRQGYSIGEPQRAHNHSTFIKQMLVDRLPAEMSVVDVPFQYIMYKMVHTDLTFEEVRFITATLVDMDVKHHPERITLVMRPWYQVQDIAYDPERAGEHVEQMLAPIKRWLSPEDYSSSTLADIQDRLLRTIEEKKTDPAFVVWAYENDVWLQIEDDAKRGRIHHSILQEYIKTLPDSIARQEELADYVLEMEYLGLEEWAKAGKKLLAEELGQ